MIRFLPLLILLASPAQARVGLDLQVWRGVSRDVDADGVSREDIDAELGVMAHYEIGVGGFRVGPRISYGSGDGDDTDNKYSALDIGGWIAKGIHAGPVGLFFGGGLGFSSGTVEPKFGDAELSGVGWHFIAGGGLTVPVGRISLVGGLYYSRHSYDELEGGNNGVKFKLEDAEAEGFIFAGGVRF